MTLSNLKNLVAGPFNVWGPEQKIYSVFDGSGCKITIFKNNTNGNIKLQVRYSTSSSTLDWIDYLEGTFINAQVIHCRLSSTSTGGSVIIKIE